MPVAPSAYFKPWESPEYAQFFASDIGEDIKKRWTAAGEQFEDEFEKSIELMKARMRQELMGYKVRMKAVEAGGKL